jgi:hypothetical protein
MDTIQTKTRAVSGHGCMWTRHGVWAIMSNEADMALGKYQARQGRIDQDDSSVDA